MFKFISLNKLLFIIYIAHLCVAECDQYLLLRYDLSFYLVKRGQWNALPGFMIQMGLQPGSQVPYTIFGEPRRPVEVEVWKLEEIVPKSPSGSSFRDHHGFFHEVIILHFISIEY